MLIKKQIRISDNLKTCFSFINKEKYLVIENSINKPFYIRIPNNIFIIKNLNVMYITTLVNNSLLESFSTYLNTCIKNIKTPTKKTLILKGLGLKSTLVQNSVVFKLGYSHLITIPIDLEKYRASIGKNYLSLLSFDKASIGNLIECFYRLKKMDCYKGRGFFYKNRPFIFKIIKKT